MLAALNNYADYSQEHGLDFAEFVPDAEKQVKLCGASCDTYPIFQKNMAVFQLSNAQHELRKGNDPRAALSQSRQYLEAFVKLSGTSYSTYTFASFADVFEAEYLLTSGGDPTSVIDGVFRILPAWKALDPQGEDPFVHEARLYQVRAGWAERHGESALSFAELALQAARKAVELGPDKPEAVVELARACVRLAALGAPKSKAELLTQGLTPVDNLLKVNADAGPVWALRAVVLKAQSQLAKDSVSQASLAKDSQVSWERARAINPLLVRTYGEDLKRP
jgi:hypothetical protein